MFLLKRRKRNKRKRFSLIKLIIMAFFSLVAITLSLKTAIDDFNNGPATVPADTSAHFQMHVIDVGQGDCTLIKCGSKNILIDGGENGNETVVLEYLRKQGVQTLDLVVATHPHSDHIGCLDTILEKKATGWTDFSPWSRAEVKGSDDVKVKTRTVYAYKTESWEEDYSTGWTK